MTHATSHAIGRIVPIKSTLTGTLVLNEATPSFSKGDRFTIRYLQGFFVLQASPQISLKINGLPVTEKVLENGDQILDGTEVLEFRLGTPGVLEFFENFTLLRHAGFLLLAIAAIVIGLLWWKPTAPQLDRLSSPLESSSETVQTPLLKLTHSERLLIARSRYVIAERLFNESSLQNGNLYHAIREWETIVQSFSDLQPTPEVATLSQTEATKARTLLDQKMKDLQSNAISTFKAGRITDFRQILHRMMETNPDPRDPLHQWAMERVFKYQNLK